MFFEAKDCQIYYEVMGSGPALIMLHGNGENHMIFNEAAQLLKQNFTLILPDSRGQGQSSKTDNIHYDLMAEDVIGLIKHLNLDRPALYGFSDGGIIALLVASSRPDLISHLIVSGANTNPDGVKRWIQNLFKLINFFKKSPLFSLMLNEPNITKEELAKITVPTLVLAGSKDLIKEEDTKFIASSIPGAKFQIIQGEGHASYIVHKRKIAKLIEAELS